MTARINAVSDRQLKLDRLRQMRVGLLATIATKSPSSDAAKLVSAKVEVLDEQVRHRRRLLSRVHLCFSAFFNMPVYVTVPQIQEAADEMLLFVQHVEEDERAIARQKRLLAAVNRIIVGCAKSATVLTVRSAGSTGRGWRGDSPLLWSRSA